MDSSSSDGAWFFAYGSLMWAPGFEYAESSLAVLGGYERDMCLLSIDHRGTRARPGLVAGLRAAPGRQVIGMAFRVPAARVQDVIAQLEIRENSPEPCYEARITGVTLVPDAVAAARFCDESAAATSPASARSASPRTVPARVFFPLASHWQHVPTLSDVDKVAILASEGRGRSGTSLEYLESLVASLAHRCGGACAIMHPLPLIAQEAPPPCPRARSLRPAPARAPQPGQGRAMAALARAQRRRSRGAHL